MSLQSKAIRDDYSKILLRYSIRRHFEMPATTHVHPSMRMGHAQQNLALVRKLALNLLRNETTAKGGIKSKRLQAGWDDAYLLSVLGVST